MSPFSFLSSFAYPSWASIPVPSIGSYLPENIQKRLVSYLLQRMLGKFVKKDGLQLEEIEAAINQGRIRLNGLQLDTEGVNASLPVDCPYRFQGGYLDAIDISLPFPNLWSGPLSLGISSIQLTLEVTPEGSRSTSPGSDASEEWDLDKSIYAASSDFIRTALNKDEEHQLQRSLQHLQMNEPKNASDRDLDPFMTTDPDENDYDGPQAPGGFPGSGPTYTADEGEQGGTAGMIETMVETLLARLQISIGKIDIRFHHNIPGTSTADPSAVDLDLKIEGIRYALNQADTQGLAKKTLTIDDVGVWMSSDEEEDDLGGRVWRGTSPAQMEIQDDLMMSSGIADLRESRYGPAAMGTGRRHQSDDFKEKGEDQEDNPAESLYESAIGDDTISVSSTVTPPGSVPAASSSQASAPLSVGYKIFGLQRKGIVIQMWKEPAEMGQEAESKGTRSRSQAHISVDLGRLAVLLDMEQMASLIQVAGSLSPPRQGRQPVPEVHRRPHNGQVPATQLQVVAASIDLRFLYTDTVPDQSHLTAFWDLCESESIEQDHLHLQILEIKMSISEPEVTTISLSTCALFDVHIQNTMVDEPSRFQPILLIGRAQDRIWLPSAEDVKQEAELAGSEEMGQATHFSVVFAKSGKSIQIGNIRLYLDPSVIERLIPPAHQLSTVYSRVLESAPKSNGTRDGSGSIAGSELRLEINVFSTRIYSPHGRDKSNRRENRSLGRLGLEASGIDLKRSVDAAIQAKLDRIQADFGQLNSVDLHTWFICGNEETESDLDKALDIRYLPNRSSRISMVISDLTFQLDQAISHRLQYFADDWATWFDTALSDSGDTSAENLRLIGSRFLVQDDMSLDTDQSDSDSTIEEGVHVECVILQAVINVKANKRIINIKATNIDTIVHGVNGSKKGNAVDCTIFSVEMSEKSPENDRFSTILRSDMRDNGRAGLETRPVVTLSFLSTQDQASSYKETLVTMNLSNTFASITPGTPWIRDLQSVLSSPPDVFANVIPSDSTRVSISMQDCTAFIPAMTRQGAISVDIGQCSLKTRLLASTSKRDVECKLAEIAVSLSDNYIMIAPKRQNGNGMIAEDGDFALICLLRESRLVLSVELGRKTKIDVSYAGIDISLCADTLETLQDVVHEISQAWSPTTDNTGASGASKSSNMQERRPPSDRQSLLGSLSDFIPSLAASSFEEDLLQDDLPNNTEFVSQNSGVRRTTNTSQSAPKLVVGNTGSIRILTQDVFELYQDYMAALEDSKVTTEIFNSSSLIVIGTAINIRLLLHGGYDWQATRSAIESETEVLRRRLRKLSQLISSGKTPPSDLRRTNVELFNSVYIGIRDEDEYQDDDQLLAAIDNELADLDSETASHTTYKSHPRGRSETNPEKGGVIGRKKLRRSRRPQMEISLRDIAFRYSVDDPEADVVGSLRMTLQRAEIIDHIKSSTWKTFMTGMKKNGTNGLEETDAKMLRVLVDWVNPGSMQTPEARISVDAAPLRFHIDQDALDFMKRFFSFTRQGEKSSSSTEPASNSTKGFIQHVEIQPLQVKIDYKPKRLNLKALQQGSAMEVINLFHFESATMTLRHVTINGVSSWGELYSQLLSIWTPDVKANQMSDLLTGIAPVRSMVKVGAGFADLILLPLEQYRKDGKIVKGMRRGASSFASNTLSEVATVGAQLATGTQVILEKAERALGGRQAQEAQLPDMMESINFTEYEASLAGKRSRYADQPANVNQGIAAAYTSLASNLTSAAQTILAVPMEVIEESGNHQSATRAVIRAVPIAVLQSMIGITDASRKTLFGVKNQLDPKNQGDRESKYKRS